MIVISDQIYAPLVYLKTFSLFWAFQTTHGITSDTSHLDTLLTCVQVHIYETYQIAMITHSCSDTEPIYDWYKSYFVSFSTFLVTHTMASYDKEWSFTWSFNCEMVHFSHSLCMTSIKLLPTHTIKCFRLQPCHSSLSHFKRASHIFHLGIWLLLFLVSRDFSTSFAKEFFTVLDVTTFFLYECHLCVFFGP